LNSFIFFIKFIFLINRSSDISVVLTNTDFEIALKKSHTSKLTSQRKAMIPNVHWNDIGGLAMAKKEILNTIQLPLLHPDLFGDLARYKLDLIRYINIFSLN